MLLCQQGWPCQIIHQRNKTPGCGFRRHDPLQTLLVQKEQRQHSIKSTPKRGRLRFAMFGMLLEIKTGRAAEDIGMKLKGEVVAIVDIFRHVRNPDILTALSLVFALVKEGQDRLDKHASMQGHWGRI